MILTSTDLKSHLMRGNSASNYKTDAWLKIKILFAVVKIDTVKRHQ